MSAINLVHVPFLGHEFPFVDRDQMTKRAPLAKAQMPVMATVPPTVLPVDGTNNMGVKILMDWNDSLGICGPAMCDHMLGIWTYGQGKAGFVEWMVNQAALRSQYLKISRGDNGTDEDMLVGTGGIFRTGIGGDKTAIVVDSLDFDVTDIPLTQFLIDNFYSVAMAWSVPNDFLQGFSAGSRWMKTDRPNPRNGHYTPLADVGSDGAYRIVTWGSWGWGGPDFIASVQPQCFVAFSPRQFSLSTGLDSKGRHITTQAAQWALVGGSPISQAIISLFPPMGSPPVPVPVDPDDPPPVPNPTPTPTPTPVDPPTPTPTPIPTPTPAPQAAGTFLADTANKVITVGSGISTVGAGLFKGGKVIWNENQETLSVPDDWTVNNSVGRRVSGPELREIETDKQDDPKASDGDGILEF